jgi:two-component system sensor histidine kinase ChvG
LSEREPFEPASAVAFLSRLDQRGDARLRVYDVRGAVIADSSRMRVGGEPLTPAASYPPVATGIRDRILYRVGAWVAGARRRLARWIRGSDRPPIGTGNGARSDEGTPLEVSSALNGRYGSTTRPSPGQRSLTLNSAVPIRRGDAVVGAVLVSQTTFRVLQALYDVRLRIFEVVVVSLFSAVLLTAMAAATVVRPLVRLRREAGDLAARRSRLPGHFGDAGRRDEIGDLARSLEELTRRLDEHIRIVEQFASDVSHEFRNPLAAIRSAAETATQADTVEDRRRFLVMLTRDIDRLERLVAGVSDVARIDTQLEQEPLSRVDVGQLLPHVVDGLRVAEPTAPDVTVQASGKPALVRGSPDRLAQVFENVLANARSFAPSGTVVDVSVRTDADGFCRVSIADRGPGIPEAHLDRIFDRFFSYRPEQASERWIHTGLGLAIARRIVQGFGGTISAANRVGGGATFEITLPQA